MFCKNCGANMEDGMKFCTVCGAPLENISKVDLGKPSDDEYDPEATVMGDDDYLGGYSQPDYGGQQSGGYDYDRLNSSYGMNGSFSSGQTQQQYSQQQYGQQQYGQQQYGQPQYGAGYGAPMGGNVMGLTERSIVTCIILSLVTCGIYGIYWIYTLTEDTNRFASDPNPTSGGMVILLSIVTCGIYEWYWMYKRGEYLDNYATQRGLPPQSNSILYLVLAIFGLGIVSIALMQNEVNKIARGM